MAHGISHLANRPFVQGTVQVAGQVSVRCNANC